MTPNETKTSPDLLKELHTLANSPGGQSTIFLPDSTRLILDMYETSLRATGELTRKLTIPEKVLLFIHFKSNV